MGGGFPPICRDRPPGRSAKTAMFKRTAEDVGPYITYGGDYKFRFIGLCKPQPKKHPFGCFFVIINYLPSAALISPICASVAGVRTSSSVMTAGFLPMSQLSKPPNVILTRSS